MTSRSGRRLALLAVACVLAVQGTALAAQPLRISKPIQATKDDYDPKRTYGAPFLAVSPDNPKIIVGGTIEFRKKQCQLIRSTDGGASWKLLDNPPVLASYPFCLENNSNIFHAPVAFGRNGTLYMATAGWDVQDTGTKASVLLHRSTNLGDSWTSTVARDARATSGQDQENTRPVTGLVVDTKSGSDDIVYISYRRALTQRTAPNAEPQQPTVIVSKDGGRTFGQPVSAKGAVFENEAERTKAISSATTVVPSPGATTTTTTTPPAESKAGKPNQVANFGATGNGQGLALDDKGNVYYAWMTGTANVTPSPASALVVSRSSDQGKTWTSAFARPFEYNNRQNPRIAWTDKGGQQGTLHVVFEGSQDPTIRSYADVHYTKSSDGGRTWTAPRRLADDDAKLLNGKYLPEIKVAPNGRIDVVWWDTRDDPGIRANDVYYTYSTDNGVSWAKNIRVTDQTIDRRFGVWGNNYDQNSPPSLASVNQYAMIGWDDTRLSRGESGAIVAADPVSGGEGVGGGLQDIFVSTVQFTAVGGGSSSAAKAVLAGVVGLLAVGLILLIVAMGSRRRSGAPAADRAAKAPAKVT